MPLPTAQACARRMRPEPVPITTCRPRAHARRTRPVRARFVGKVDGLPAGWWVGVHYDEPVGKNDGSVKGVRYFACPPGHGGLLRPARVRVGDFPELDAFAFDSDDEI